MRKSIMTFATVLCCAIWIPMSFTACVDYDDNPVYNQTSDLSRFFNVDSINLRTIKRYTQDFTVEEYLGEKMYAGIQYVWYNLEELMTQEEIPQIQLNALTALCTLCDAYGRECSHFDASGKILEEVNDYLEYSSGNWGSSKSLYSHSFNLTRGGEYVFKTQFDFLRINKQENVVVYDEPSIRIKGDPIIKTGGGADIMAHFNTGYPYDINSLKDEEYTKVTVYKQVNDSMAAEIWNQQYPLHLKDDTYPLLAGIDSLEVKFEKPQIGAYAIRFETSWDAIKTRDFFLSVEDTLRASATLDKQTYDLLNDKSACLRVKMDYGYPHIAAVKPDSIPTIRITATLLKEINDNNTSDTLFTDTLALVNDTLATKDLLYEEDWILEWTNMKTSGLTEGDSTFLQVAIVFNGRKQFETKIPVSFKPTASVRNKEDD